MGVIAPYGVFSVAGGAPRVGVRVGEGVIDLAAELGDEVFARPSLNAFMAQGPRRWAEIGSRVNELDATYALDEVTPRLPVAIADYVDFYASEHHASNLGKLLRPNAAPLLPNWKHMPVGYHGRAGTVVVSGTDIVRPCGQLATPDGPVFGPSRRLDIEAELGFLVGVGGARITPANVAEHVFGVVVVNDWSARDIQSWEYAPLGPFLGKSFATSISPWVTPLAALDAARIRTPIQDPEPLPYLRGAERWGLDIDLEVRWNGRLVSRPPYAGMYWSPAQMLAHLTANGATARTGDLFASGTVSGPARDQRGSFIELTWNGAEPIAIGGEPRTFLEDGDEVTIAAAAPGPDGTRVELGEVRGRILPA
ncbi:fumarylacetoacetate hydrolase family protein [Nocardia harenae]|uniref:fumarylacetoacetate hydrolase family protein n=1 Tax=Nocardia harenae TaxID=358707 RepID=UPI000A690E26|nr:fumarylacetoacetate hydrolase family protein [Nocardia harenae]